MGGEGQRGLAVRLSVRVARAFEGIWTVPLALALGGFVLALAVGPLGAALGAGSWVDPDGGRAALSAVVVLTLTGVLRQD